MYLFVGAVVGSVYVVVNGGGNHRMIEGGVEIDFVVLVVAFYFNLSELPVPVCFRFGEVFVEVVFRVLRLAGFWLRLPCLCRK